MEARTDRELSTATALVPQPQRLHANAAVFLESAFDDSEVRDATVDLLRLSDLPSSSIEIFKSQLEAAKRHHEREPLNPRIALNYAAALTSCGDANGALKVLNRSLFSEADIDLELERIRALAALGRWEEAKVDVEHLLARSSIDTDAVLQLATIAFMAGDLKTARSLYEELESAGALTVAGGNNLGVIEFFQNDRRSAIGTFRSALRSHVNYAVAYHNLAACQIASRAFQKAEANARAAIRLVPSYRSAHVVLAKALLAQRKLDEAEGAVKSALIANPNVPELLDIGAKIAFERKDFRTSFRRLTTAMYVDTASYPRLNNAAVALLELKEWHRAIPLLRSALALQPERRFAYENLALAYLRLGDLQAAEHVIQSGLTAVPDEEREGLLLLLLSAAVRSGHRDAGLLAVEALLSRNKLSERAFLAAAVFLSEEVGRSNDAVGVLEKALDMYPNDEKIANNLAYLLIPFGRMEEANRILERFSHLYDEYPYLAATRGLYRIVKGDLEGGKKLYRRAIEHFTHRTERQRAKQKLDLELGRAYLLAGSISKASAHLKAATRANVYSTFTEEARRLLLSTTPS